jgi:non-haem Fe2+, alpha-ketoglutarate-dependent halogenase
MKDSIAASLEMESKTESILSEEQLARYERDGFLFPIKVLAPLEVSKYRSGFEELESHFGGKLEYAALTHLYFSWAYDLATRQVILDRVEEILGEDILVQSTLILCKYPHDPAFVAWHQDVKYTNQDSRSAISAWVALSDSTPDSGCMRVIPRSHGQGVLPHLREVARHSLVTNSVAADETEAVDVVLGAGEMSLHHSDIVHGSAPNRSGQKRIGFIIRFVTSDYQRTENPVIRARGQGESGHLTFWDRSPAQSIEENISAWMEFGRERNLIK